jgi:hypothetical protein
VGLARVSASWAAGLVVLLATLPSLHAQGPRTDSVGQALGFVGSGTFLLMAIAVFALNLVPLAWVARDAKTRGVGQPDFWVALVLFFSLLGLVGYLMWRPWGPIVRCADCGHHKSAALTTCPRCQTRASERIASP